MSADIRLKAGQLETAFMKRLMPGGGSLIRQDSCAFAYNNVSGKVTFAVLLRGEN